MSEQTAKTVVLVAGGLMFAAIGLRRSSIDNPLRFAWGAGALTLFLTLLADISPEVAGPFAILVLIAVYWTHRDVFSANNPVTNPSGNGSAQAAPADRKAPLQ